METRRPDNIFPLTKEEILGNFNHVFNNEFQTRRIEHDFVWNLWTDETHFNWFRDTYTKGHSTAAILVDKDGQKDYVEFWRYYGRHGVSYAYSFKRREMFKEILK
jgi:hypothetical protein